MRVKFKDTGQAIDQTTAKSEPGEKEFTSGGYSLDAGYEKVTPHYGTRFCSEEVQERNAKIQPFNAEPVEGGFIPLNNVFDRI